ncbi:MAG: YkgJ family cysteine cluster protein [Proteobacteria bacterium]|nr:YkgJ family cysteine cluster protein [Pseudomonadota bacterium]MBU1739515.1 YkgJ family cysteine cluster protein [Pseudomonadota bacterium]
MDLPDKIITSAPQCRRCGTCCRNGGPALHNEDLGLIGESLIPLSRLVTIRQNEPALNQQTSQLDPDRGEFLKISGAAGCWTCIFWNEAGKGCGIYEERPLECRLLFCEDTSGIERVIGRNLLTREKVPGLEEDIMKAVHLHESACSFLHINDLVARFLADPSALEKLEEISALVRKDLRIRDSFFAARPEMRQNEMFIFGRPLFLVLSPFGFWVVEANNTLDVQFADAQMSRRPAAIS